MLQCVAVSTAIGDDFRQLPVTPTTRTTLITDATQETSDKKGIAFSMPGLCVPFERKNQFPPGMRPLPVTEIRDNSRACVGRLPSQFAFNLGQIRILPRDFDHKMFHQLAA